MKERPILFSAPMVNAILAGDKTQTRRIAKPQPFDRSWSKKDHNFGYTTDDEGIEFYAYSKSSGGQWSTRCPYGQQNDRLFVRETFFAYGRWITQFSAKKGRDEWHFIDMTKDCDRAYQYASDNPDIPLATGRGPLPGWYRRPAIFMPRIACRITLEIVSVRVERLQDISEADAISEGVTMRPAKPSGAERMARNAYSDLWESINGAGSWEANPFVWVVEFKRVEQ